MPSLTIEQQETWSQTRQPAILGICILFFLLGNLSVPMRIWAQWINHKRPLAEDYCLVLALIFANVVTVATLVSAEYGLGLHIWRVKAEDPTLQTLVKSFTSIWLTAVFNAPALVATKLSLLFYYRRLFLVHQSWLRIAWWLNLVFVVMWSIFCMLFYILQCTPPSYYWKRIDPNNHIENGKCPIPDRLDYIAIPLILSVISDFTILLLPVLTVLTLQTVLIRRLGLAAIFSIGFLSFSCGIARIVVLLVSTNTRADATWNVVSFEVLNVIELNLAILCASAIPIVSRFKMMLRRKDEVEYPSQELLNMPTRLNSNSNQNLGSGRSTRCESRDDRHWNTEDGRIMVKVDVNVG